MSEDLEGIRLSQVGSREKLRPYIRKNQKGRSMESARLVQELSYMSIPQHPFCKLPHAAVFISVPVSY